MWTLEAYIKARKRGKTMQEIQDHECISEATAYCWEIGYQSYLKRISLDKVLEMLGLIHIAQIVDKYKKALAVETREQMINELTEKQRSRCKFKKNMEELIELLKEVDDYVSGNSHDHI